VTRPARPPVAPGVTGRAPQMVVEPDASAPSKPNVLKQSAADSSMVREAGGGVENGYVEVKFKKPLRVVKTRQAGWYGAGRTATTTTSRRANALENNVSPITR